MELFQGKTFSSSYTNLQVEEQKSVRESTLMFYSNPAHPSLQKHRLDRCRDPGFWSLRCTRDIRIILHESEHGTVLCHADHHDKAYAWAEKRKFVSNPTTGAMQIVEIRDLFVPDKRPKAERLMQSRRQPIFGNLPRTEFAWIGVPAEWIDDVRTVRSEDELLDLIVHLPEEAGEALLTLADGGKPHKIRKVTQTANPFLAPDAARRFYAIESQTALEAALSASWDDWRIFLHPSQRKLVEATFNGDTRVSGGPGTGKTVVALHRAVYLTREDTSARILITTISKPLAASLRQLVEHLAGKESNITKRITVAAIDTLPETLLSNHHTEFPVAEEAQVREALSQAVKELALSMYSDDFLFDEWSQVIEAFEVANLDAYTNLSRRGRLVRLNRKQRSKVWEIVDLATRLLKDHKLTPPFRQVRNVARQLTNGSLQQPFDYIIIDECQDLRHEHLVLLNAMRKTPQSLFFTGDLAQRIRQPLVSWLSAGINIAGRSYTLKVNYRTTQQIRSWADRLVMKQFQDMDGMIEDRKYTISIFSGIPPEVRQYPSEEEEQLGISRWFEQVFESGVKPHECCLFIRSYTLFERARTVSQLVNCDHLFLDQGDTPDAGKIAIATMPNAEGLEFKAVAVMACDEWIIPLQSRLNGTMHDADTQAILDMERQLLYVAATRARDFLLITGTTPISRFLQELR